MSLFRRGRQSRTSPLGWMSAPPGPGDRREPFGSEGDQVGHAEAVALLKLAAEECEPVNYVTVTGILLADASRGVVSEDSAEEGTRLLIACASLDERDQPGQTKVRAVSDLLSEPGMEDLKAGRQVLVSGHLGPGGIIRASTVVPGGGDLVESQPQGASTDPSEVAAAPSKTRNWPCATGSVSCHHDKRRRARRSSED